MIENIIDHAYELYMPQVRSEITELSKFIQSQMKDELDDYSAQQPIPFNILEIGTKFGGTFYIWNKLVQNHGSGQCISIDMSDGGLHGGISEEEMDKRDLWFKERFNDCHFIRGNSHDVVTMKKVGMFSKLNGDTFNIIPFIDFLFIDGDHTFEGVKTDFEMYSPLVKQGSCIAFHDIIISDHHHSRDVYVGEFWNEIKNDDRFDSFEFVEPGNNWGGIGVLIKK